jgi:hypothetical protein
MELDKALEILSGSKPFAVFLAYVESQREGAIASLHGASKDDVQQISGKIVALDEILQSCEYKKILKNTEFIP